MKRGLMWAQTCSKVGSKALAGILELPTFVIKQRQEEQKYYRKLKKGHSNRRRKGSSSNFPYFFKSVSPLLYTIVYKA